MVADEAIRQALAEYGDDNVGRAAIEMLAPVLRDMEADSKRLDYLDRCAGAFRFPMSYEPVDFDYHFEEPPFILGFEESARTTIDRSMKEHP